MHQKNSRKRLNFSLIFIQISSLIIISTLTPLVSTSQASSTWIQKSESDFVNGTFNNISIINTGDEALLILEDPESESGNWTKLNPNVSPDARSYHAMASNHKTDQIVLFGGIEKSPIIYGDTWIYDEKLGNWIEKKPIKSPIKRFAHAITTIFGTDKALLFGGLDGTNRLEDNWLFDFNNNTWIEKTPNIRPGPRSSHAMCSIYGTDKVLLFGGNLKEYPYKSNQTWVYDLSENNWARMGGSISPSFRDRAAMAPIYGTDKVLLFGGYSYYGLDNETWIFDLSDNKWTQLKPFFKPKAKSDHSMSTILNTNKILLFGGYEGEDETWVYDYRNNNWSFLDLPYKPKQRNCHAMSTLYGSEKIILFGGTDSQPSNDTWTYTHLFSIRNGNYISVPYDTCINPSFKEILWNSITTLGTSVTIQLRSADYRSNLGSKDFIGPDGLKTSYYTQSPSNIWSGHSGDRWVQYKVYLDSMNNLETPYFINITINYNCRPNAILKYPSNESILINNKPTFSWNFDDVDSVQQSAFQVILSNVSNFDHVIYDSGVQSDSLQQWKFPNGTSYTSLSDGNWYWKLRVKDIEGDWGDYSPIWKFIIDTDLPESKIIEPVNNGHYNSLKMIMGITNDSITGTGINKVEICITNLGNHSYWSGTNWHSSESWLTAFGMTDWEYDCRLITWSTGLQYQICSRAIDNATNFELPYTTTTFIFDETQPISMINIPKNDAVIQNLTVIMGNATDSFTEIDFIEISIKYPTINKYWNGSNWEKGECWLKAMGKKTWFYNTANIKFSSDDKYIIYSRATDVAGNIEPKNFGNTFTFDNKPPEILEFFINHNSDYTNSTAVVLSILSKDSGSGVSEIAFKNNGSNWTYWEQYTTEKEFNLSIGDGIKTVYCKVQDRIGNTAEAIIDTIILDTAPPIDLSIDINNNSKFTNNKKVIVLINAIDLLSGLDKISFSFDGVVWLAWEDYEQIKEVDLLSGDGKKTIHFRIKDKVGNIAYTNQNIILDTISPHSLSIIINDGAATTNSTIVFLKLKATDVTSGVYLMCFSSDGRTWSAWENFTDSKIYTLTDDIGEKRIYFNAKDYAGNMGKPFRTTIILHQDKPMISPIDNDDEYSNDSNKILIIFVILIIIAIIICIGVYKFKKPPIKNSTL